MQIPNCEQLLVSVIIPVYNRVDTIKRSIKSVLMQTYKNIEIIVVDDGSTDGTLEILEGFEQDKIKIFVQNHKGANAARNLGIEKSKGEFISFQDSDDEWLPDKLEKQIAYMLENNYEACYCPFFLLNTPNSRIIPEDFNNKEKYEIDVIKVLRRYNVVSTQTLIIHKNVIKDIGLFDEEMPRYQDYEYVIRLIQKKKIGYISKPLVKVYRTKNSISNDDKRVVEAGIRLLKKHQTFFDMHWCLENRLKKDICELGKKEFEEKIDSINEILKKYLNGKTINIYKILNEILYNKYKLCNSLCIMEYEEKVERLHSHDFAIYGAGTVGKKIYLELKEKKLIPRYFLVTEKQDYNELYGVPVITLREWNEKDIVVIIGVSIELQNDLIENLIQIGHMNYFRYPEGV